MVDARTRVFEHRSTFAATPQAMFDFHAAPNAFSKLTPPPIFIQVLHNGLTSLTSGEVDFRMWFGPIPIHWIARHEPGPIPTSFIDRQLTGPLAYWQHEHIFQPVGSGVELIDRVTLAHKPGLVGWLTRLMFDGLPLRLLFVYRHLRTRLALRK
jgi:ligand-binding SRPBCC domain-containing protein